MVGIFGGVTRPKIRLVTLSVECIAILTVLLKLIFVLITRFECLIVDIKLFMFIGINPSNVFAIIYVCKIRAEN